jgi:alkylhydroperoxidase family enzyme
VNHFRLEANSPLYTWVQQAEALLLAGIGKLEAELMNLASVAISGINGRAYCFGAWCTLLDHTTNDR